MLIERFSCFYLPKYIGFKSFESVPTTNRFFFFAFTRYLHFLIYFEKLKNMKLEGTYIYKVYIWLRTLYRKLSHNLG